MPGAALLGSMDPDIEPLSIISVVPEHLAPYELESMVLVSDETIEWNCNWKTSVDIFPRPITSAACIRI